jgi:hypothetical protein
MEYLLLLFPLAAIAYSFKLLRKIKRAVRFLQWKRNRDRLTIEQFVQGLESQYYIAKMKEFYKNE